MRRCCRQQVFRWLWDQCRVARFGFYGRNSRSCVLTCNEGQVCVTATTQTHRLSWGLWHHLSSQSASKCSLNGRKTHEINVFLLWKTIRFSQYWYKRITLMFSFSHTAQEMSWFPSIILCNCCNWIKQIRFGSKKGNVLIVIRHKRQLFIAVRQFLIQTHFYYCSYFSLFFPLMFLLKLNLKKEMPLKGSVEKNKKED